MSADCPQFGRQKVQILPDGQALVHSTSETVLARPDEDRDGLLQRLRSEYGVGPADMVEIVFKAGTPQYAIVEWALATEFLRIATAKAVRQGVANGTLKPE